MAYKDKDLQRETTRDRVRRWRALHQGVTLNKGEALQGVTPRVLQGINPRVKAAPKMGYEVFKPSHIDADGQVIPEYA